MKHICQVIILSTLSTLLLQVSFAETEKPVISMTLDQAINKVRQETDTDTGTESKVLSSETKIVKNKEIHVIKILTEKGRIQYISIDAETGKKLNFSKEK